MYGGLIVLILLVVAVIAYRFYTPTHRLLGYWSAPSGQLFEIDAPQKGEYVANTASGFMGADSERGYPVSRKGVRGIVIEFPNGAISGRISFDRRRIIWDQSQTWYRQGLEN